VLLALSNAPKASPLITTYVHCMLSHACWPSCLTEEQLDKMAEYLEAYQDQCSVCSVFFSLSITFKY